MSVKEFQLSILLLDDMDFFQILTITHGTNEEVPAASM